jgi:hypothetical protein
VIEGKKVGAALVETARPLANPNQVLLVDIISTLASTCASIDKGRCTAIWSPSKSALKPLHTSGWMRMALPTRRSSSHPAFPKVLGQMCGFFRL